MKKTILLVLAALFLLGCGANQDPANIVSRAGEAKTAYPLVITDSFDRNVTIEKEPLRVISIAPSITETIFALGKEDVLVGRTDYCDYPAEVLEISSIGTLTEPNIEIIAALKPDVVFASTHFKKASLEAIEQLGVPVVMLYGQNSFESVYDIISTAGMIFNVNDRAAKLVNDMKTKVENTISVVKNASKPSVYYVVGFGEWGDYTAGGDTFIGNLITMAGGENIAGDVSGWSYSLEKIVEKNPRIMICSIFGDTKESLKQANGYKDLSAILENRLYEVDNNMIDRQGPRLADGLEALAKVIHPDLFQ